MLQLLMNYMLLVLCCWPAADADNILVCCCISSLTCLLPAIIYLRRQAIVSFFRYGCNNRHRYVGEIFLFLGRSRWSGHVPEKYLPVITAAATAETAADAGDGALYWCCSICTAAAAPGAPPAALYC